jgi:hypothetical protein
VSSGVMRARIFLLRDVFKSRSALKGYDRVVTIGHAYSENFGSTFRSYLPYFDIFCSRKQRSAAKEVPNVSL